MSHSDHGRQRAIETLLPCLLRAQSQIIWGKKSRHACTNVRTQIPSYFYSFVIVNTVLLGQFKRELWITCFYFARAYTWHYRFILTDCVFFCAHVFIRRRTFSWWEKRRCAGCSSFQLPPRQDHWHDCDNLFGLLRCFARRPNSTGVTVFRAHPSRRVTDNSGSF